MVAYLTDRKARARSRNQVFDSGFGLRRVSSLRHGSHLCRPQAPWNSRGCGSCPSSGSGFALLAGIALTITGIGFKLGVVPFHLWTPDVYQGAPPPVTAFVATTSKSAMVALLLRYVYLSGALQYRAVFLVFAIIAILSMCAGNLLALRQTNVKRILAYSSIAHFGYILVAFLAGSTMAIEAVAFYLVAYTVTMLAAFGIVTVLSGSESRCRGSGRLSRSFLAAPGDRRRLHRRVAIVRGHSLHRWVSWASSMCSPRERTRGAWPLIVILVVSSVAGLFYYLRIVVALYADPAEQAVPALAVSRSTILVLGCSHSAGLARRLSHSVAPPDPRTFTGMGRSQGAHFLYPFQPLGLTALAWTRCFLLGVLSGRQEHGRWGRSPTCLLGSFCIFECV